jgi:response regulator RpfG family c-di-GMP phosphodiesterase
MVTAGNSDTKSSPKKVMICDDELDVLRAYKIALNSRFDVLTASSGSECLETYSKAVGSEQKVDVVVLDYRLGDMLGDQVAQKLKDIGTTNVILLTAFEIEPAHIDELKNQKIIKLFLKKPISLAALISSINQMTS